MVQTMIIELQDICKNYIQGTMEFQILKNINFTMNEGEYTAIMGPSGSGKSTLMNLIGCLDQPTSGRYFLDGQDVSSYSDAMDNVALPLSYAGISRKERKERAIEMLGRVGLSERVSFMPNQLSGGQKQRVAIARAMINHPRILLADEPTGALDSASGKQVMQLFRELNDTGVTILMITHDAEIASHADRVVEIRDGLLNTEVEI